MEKEKEMRYYIQRVDKGWDEVDEFIYSQWDRVYDPVKGDEEPQKRYCGNRFTVSEDGTVHMELPKRIESQVLGMIARICGVSIPQHSVPGGFAPIPKGLLTVKLKGSKAKHPLFYDVSTGQKLRVA